MLYLRLFSAILAGVSFGVAVIHARHALGLDDDQAPKPVEDPRVEPAAAPAPEPAADPEPATVDEPAPKEDQDEPTTD